MEKFRQKHKKSNKNRGADEKCCIQGWKGADNHWTKSMFYVIITRLKGKIKVLFDG